MADLARSGRSRRGARRSRSVSRTSTCWSSRSPPACSRTRRRRGATGTLVNRLLGMGVPLAPAGGPASPGIVHRLDAGTSGLLVVAKTDEAYRLAAGRVRRHEVDRRYLALVRGAPRTTTSGRGAARPAGRADRGRPRRGPGGPTGSRCASVWRAATLLEARRAPAVRTRSGSTSPRSGIRSWGIGPTVVAVTTPAPSDSPARSCTRGACRSYTRHGRAGRPRGAAPDRPRRGARPRPGATCVLDAPGARRTVGTPGITPV